jgi:hypothetical protein
VVGLYGLGSELYEIYSCLEFRTFIRDYPDRDAALEAAAAAADLARATNADRDRPAGGETPGSTGDTGAGNTPPASDGDAATALPRDGVSEYGAEDDDGAQAPSVDDILGTDDGDDQRSGAEETPPRGPRPDEPERRWPGEPRVEKPEPAGWPGERETGPGFVNGRDGRPESGGEDPAPGGEPPATEDASPKPPGEAKEPPPTGPPKPEPTGAPEREPTELESRFVDMSDRVDGVDVNSAVSDKNIDKDERIRKVGWRRYGEKLKQRNTPRKK